MEKLFKSMKEGEDWFYKCFGKGETFDAMARSIHL
jgi:stage V sporulation protein AF